MEKYWDLGSFHIRSNNYYDFEGMDRIQVIYECKEKEEQKLGILRDGVLLG